MAAKIDSKMPNFAEKLNEMIRKMGRFSKEFIDGSENCSVNHPTYG